MNLNVDDEFESLGINDYSYKFEPVSNSRRRSQDSSINTKYGLLSYPIPPQLRSAGLLLFILISFGLGFNYGINTVDLSTFNTNTDNTKSIHTYSAGPAVHNFDYQKKTFIELIGDLSKERSIQEKQLRDVFGDYYYGMLFENPIVMEKLFLKDPLSKERLLRRLIIKILTAHLKDTNVNVLETFTWATGGDSAAAGHGNLYLQSYTNILDETVQGAFQALGIHFRARNYAMGGYTSAPELALCMEAIYGTDLDVLVWDFSITEEVYIHFHGADQKENNSTSAWKDNDMSYKASLWGHRAGIHPTKPILFMMDSRKGKRWDRLSKLVDRGIGAFLMDSDGMKEVLKMIPNTKTNNPTKEDIQFKESLPPILQYLRCEDDSIEGSIPCDDPMNYLFCVDEKAAVCRENKFYTQKVCTDARYQRAHNPGWKVHYLKGKLLGNFLLGMLTEAVIEVDALLASKTASIKETQLNNENLIDGRHTTYPKQKLRSLLEFLQSKEKDDKNLFHNTPPAAHEWTTHVTDTLVGVDPNVLYRSHTICHTALLPSQTRFEGILTEKMGIDSNPYDLGINKIFLRPVDDGNLPLVWDPNDRQRCQALEIDHKDFFFVRTDDAWVSVTIPNQKEKEAYLKWGQRLSKREGLIMVCLRTCPFMKCPEGNINFQSLRGVLDVKINGKSVVGAQQLDECHFLEGNEGLRWGVKEQQYLLNFKIEQKTGKWMKITSIILF